MSQQRNIGGDGNDLSYRYKMPKMITKVEGRGNGIKTRLVNMYDVGKALHRDPAYVTKFFGCELGAQSKISEKNLEYIVNGNHDTKKFEDLLDVFIDKYVLCPNCKLPETDLSVKKESIFSTCNACGHRAMLDSGHRIAQYIIKCPPKERDRVKIKASKQAQKAKEDEELVKNASALKVKDDSDVNWSTDVSADAAKKRLEGSSLKDMLQHDDGTPASTEPVDVIRKASRDPENDPQAICKLVRNLQKRDKFGNLQRTAILFEALFTENIVAELKPNAEVIKTLCNESRTQKTLLVCLEKFLESEQTLIAKLPDILMGLYDFELVPEELLIEFFKSPKQKGVSPEHHARITKAATPFIEWLEEEGEEEEEEEEEFERVPADEGASDDEDEPAPAVPVSATASKVKSTFLSVDSDSDSDVDLDDL